VKDQGNILNEFLKRQKPSVPQDYFDQFHDSLELDQTQTSILDQLVKSEKPSVAANDFIKLNQAILNEVKSNSSEDFISQLSKSKRPGVPNSFFEAFPEELSLIAEKESKIIVLNWVKVISSIAAITLIGLLSYNWFMSENTTSEVNVAQETEISLETYLTYLDEEDIVNYYINEGISYSDNDEIELNELYEYTTEDIENLYYDLN
jgi:hypothetical protein